MFTNIALNSQNTIDKRIEELTEYKKTLQMLEHSYFQESVIIMLHQPPESRGIMLENLFTSHWSQMRLVIKKHMEKYPNG